MAKVTPAPAPCSEEALDGAPGQVTMHPSCPTESSTSLANEKQLNEQPKEQAEQAMTDAPEQLTMSKARRSLTLRIGVGTQQARGDPKIARKCCAALWSCCLRRFDNSAVPIACKLCVCKIACCTPAGADSTKRRSSVQDVQEAIAAVEDALEKRHCDGMLDGWCGEDNLLACLCCPCCLSWVLWAGMCHELWGLETQMVFNCSCCGCCKKGRSDGVDCGDVCDSWFCYMWACPDLCMGAEVCRCCSGCSCCDQACDRGCDCGGGGCDCGGCDLSL
eukprot:TRINITY_DN90957_c0_g1_i1.p1 TRINITY_DN90957_c0_g1~~TRINITY_DN90957_c0_g1_i1.p1  ORF type:complete len:276 (+),score=21.20 TRINITY_DN90957_c0_g1_i1:32-859(+)